MNQGQTIFSQVIDFLPKKKFHQCVNRYSGNHRIRSFTCYNQFLCMAFAQLAYRESLRDIAGIEGRVKDELSRNPCFVSTIQSAIHTSLSNDLICAESIHKSMTSPALEWR